MKSRRKAREIALAWLYQWDVRGPEVLDEMDEMLVLDRRPSDVADYVKDLVRGTIDHADELDAALTAAADHWRVGRMAIVDRNILRMACYEMTRQGDVVPPKVAINEAIELGKRYSTENSGAFVNGVLDRVRRNLGL